MTMTMIAFTTMSNQKLFFSFIIYLFIILFIIIINIMTMIVINLCFSLVVLHYRT